MALPTLSADQIEDIYVSTFNVKLPEVIDNVYASNPTLAILNAEERIILQGGKEIEQALIYAKLPGGSYARGDTFDTSRKNTKTAFIVPWKLHYVNLTIDGMDDLQNAGAAAAFDYAELKAQEAELTCKDNLGSELYGNSGDNAGKALHGFEEWVDDGTNFSPIAGITRDTTDVGTAAKSVYDATGGSLTIPVLQTQFGTATIENERPTLIATTQTLWNALYNRMQPVQRIPSGPGFDYLARMGFDTLEFNRARVIVDSHIDSGRLYGINLKYVKLVVHAARNFVLRGWMPTSNKDERINQLLWSGNLVVGGPRFCLQMRGLTA